MFKVVLVDDNKIILEKFKNMLYEVGKNQNIEMEITTFSNPVEAYNRIKSKDYNYLHLVYLDIMMDTIGGIEIAKMIQERNMRASIIFLSASDEYKFQVYDSEKVQHLHKSDVTQEVFTKAFMQAYEYQKNLIFTSYLCRDDKGNEKTIELRNVMYFENVDGVIKVYEEKQTYTVVCDPQEFMEAFKQEDIAVIDYRFAIHLPKVMKIQAKTIYFMNGLEILLDEKQTTAIKIALANYLATAL